MKMTMHIDETVLTEVMRVTGAKSKTKAVAIALGEIARKAKLKAILNRGLGLSADELRHAFKPAPSFDGNLMVAEDPPPYPAHDEHHPAR